MPQKSEITLDQLTSARDKLFDEAQSAQEKEDWTAYCKAIDATRAELGLWPPPRPSGLDAGPDGTANLPVG